ASDRRNIAMSISRPLAGVAYQIPSAVNSSETAAAVGYHGATLIRWSLASLGPPATVRATSGGLNSAASLHPRETKLPRAVGPHAEKKGARLARLRLHPHR